MSDTSGRVNEAPLAEPFRAWVGQWASGVVVVIAGEGDAMRAATVASFTPVSFAPPLTALFLSRASRMRELLGATGRWTVSVLGEQSYALARHFAHPARVTGDAALLKVGIVELEGFPPALSDAAAWLTCTLEASFDLGDHTGFVGRVARFERRPDIRPLVAWRGKLHRLGEVAAPPGWAALDADDLSANW